MLPLLTSENLLNLFGFLFLLLVIDSVVSMAKNIEGIGDGE